MGIRRFIILLSFAFLICGCICDPYSKDSDGIDISGLDKSNIDSCRGRYSNCNHTGLTDTEYPTPMMLDVVELTGDPEYCVIFGDGVNHDCYRNIARASNNPAICEGIEDDTYRQFCFNGLFFEKTNSMSICENVKNKTIRDECYITYGRYTKDINACLGDVDERCFWGVAEYKDPEKTCPGLKPADRKKCYRSFALADGDSGNCDMVGSIDDADICKMDMVLNKFPEPSICREIKSTSLSYDCYEHIYRNIARASNNPAICEGIEGYTYRKFCLEGLFFEKTNSMSICENVKNKTIRDDCYITYGRYTKDINACLGDVDERCFWGVAEYKDPEKTCPGLKPADRKKCYRSFALGDGNSGYCDMVGSIDDADICRMDMVLKKWSDSPICREIKSTKLRNACLTVIKERPFIPIWDRHKMPHYNSNEDMERKTNADRTRTVAYIESLMENIRCESISEPAFRDKCYFDEADKNQKPGYCQLISDIETQTLCISRLAASLQNESLCDWIFESLHIREKDQCFISLASIKKDPGICSLLDNERSSKDICYEELTKETDKLEYCNMIDNSLYKSGCIEYVAVKTDNMSLCMAKEVLFKDSCVSKFAIKRDDAQICNMVRNLTEYSRCISSVALATKNPNLCESIPLQYEKENCQKNTLGYYNDRTQYKLEGRPKIPSYGEQIIIVYYTPGWIGSIFKEIDEKELQEKSTQLVFKAMDQKIFEPPGKDIDIAITCAYQQGKMREFVETFPKWSKTKWGIIPIRDDLDYFHKEVGLDPAKFNQCMNSSEIARIIDEDLKEAETNKIMAAPTFITQGKTYSGLIHIKRLIKATNQ